MLRSLLLIALLAGSLSAADVILPQAGKLAGVVISDEAGDWGVLAADLTTIEPKVLDGGRVCIFEGLPGRYAVIKVPKGGGLKISTVVLGGINPTPPVPAPPGPTPPTPTPPTPPDPTPAGPRGITIIRESADKTPAMARLETALRSGPQAQYLASKSHKLLILDDDSQSGDGKPSPLVEAWRPIFSGMPLPVLIIFDPATRDVIAKQALPATAEAVIEAIKKAGG